MWMMFRGYEEIGKLVCVTSGHTKVELHPWVVFCRHVELLQKRSWEWASLLVDGSMTRNNFKSILCSRYLCRLCKSH